MSKRFAHWLDPISPLQGEEALDAHDPGVARCGAYPGLLY